MISWTNMASWAYFFSTIILVVSVALPPRTNKRLDDEEFIHFQSLLSSVYATSIPVLHEPLTASITTTHKSESDAWPFWTKKSRQEHRHVEDFGLAKESGVDKDHVVEYEKSKRRQNEVPRRRRRGRARTSRTSLRRTIMLQDVRYKGTSKRSDQEVFNVPSVPREAFSRFAYLIKTIFGKRFRLQASNNPSSASRSAASAGLPDLQAGATTTPLRSGHVPTATLASKPGGTSITHGTSDRDGDGGGVSGESDYAGTTPSASAAARATFQKMLTIITLFGDHIRHQSDGAQAAEAAGETTRERGGVAATVGHASDNATTALPSATGAVHWTTMQSPPRNYSARDLGCLRVEGYGGPSDWIQVVNNCPAGWPNSTVRYLCTANPSDDYIMTDTPVQDVSGTVYMNRHCAVCNGVTKIIKWKVAWTCEGGPLVHAELLPSAAIRRDLMVILQLLRRDRRCQLHRTPALPEAIRPCSNVLGRGPQVHFQANGGDRVPPGTGYPVSLNILMNFDFSGKTHILFADFYTGEEMAPVPQTLCPRRYIMDRDGHCREVTCGDGYHLDDRELNCVPDDDPHHVDEQEVLTDLSQLAQTNDYERVTLTAEVETQFIPLFVNPDYLPLWKEQIARQLNISTDRIVMFNLTAEGATGEGSTLLIEKLTGHEINLEPPIDHQHPIETLGTAASSTLSSSTSSPLHRSSPATSSATRAELIEDEEVAASRCGSVDIHVNKAVHEGSRKNDSDLSWKVIDTSSREAQASASINSTPAFVPGHIAFLTHPYAYYVEDRDLPVKTPQHRGLQSRSVDKEVTRLKQEFHEATTEEYKKQNEAGTSYTRIISHHAPSLTSEDSTNVDLKNGITVPAIFVEENAFSGVETRDLVDTHGSDAFTAVDNQPHPPKNNLEIQTNVTYSTILNDSYSNRPLGSKVHISSKISFFSEMTLGFSDIKTTHVPLVEGKTREQTSQGQEEVFGDKTLPRFGTASLTLSAEENKMDTTAGESFEHDATDPFLIPEMQLISDVLQILNQQRRDSSGLGDHLTTSTAHPLEHATSTPQVLRDLELTSDVIHKIHLYSEVLQLINTNSTSTPDVLETSQTSAASPPTTTTDPPPSVGKIIVTFILRPPESFRSGERSESVVEELNSLVSMGELRFTMNGTSLKLQNMAEQDSGNMFGPYCPDGIVLLLDGDLVELHYTQTSATESNVTLLRDLRTNKTYPTGMFDVSFFLTQPIDKDRRDQAQSFIYNALVCEMPRIVNQQCERIRISKEEYSIQGLQKTLIFQNQTYNFSSYEFQEGDPNRSVEICIPESYSGPVIMQPTVVRVRYKNCASGYEQWLKVEGYLTAVLGRVSIAALFSVLLTYCLFARLRNLPGVNTMSLTFSLFLAEVIFITGEEVQIPWLCTLVAVSLHYFFLASHCWMNVMSYDVYRTFAGNTCILTRVRDKTKFFPRYALYAWGLPLLIVGGCLFIDFSHVMPSISISYGGTWAQNDGLGSRGNWSHYPYVDADVITMATTSSSKMLEDPVPVADTNQWSGRSSNRSEDDDTAEKSPLPTTPPYGDHSLSCWIQKPLAAMLAFGAPILLVFLLNCAFFVRTICSIQSTSRLARHSGAGRTSSGNSSSKKKKLSGRSDVILYVKMASVMGFTWVFGLASSLISAVTEEPSEPICYSLHVLGVFFPILNSSQGLFIFFAFVFNRRVLGLYRELFGRLRDTLLLHKRRVNLVPCRGGKWACGRKKKGYPTLSNIAIISRD